MRQALMVSLVMICSFFFAAVNVDAKSKGASQADINHIREQRQ